MEMRIRNFAQRTLRKFPPLRKWQHLQDQKSSNETTQQSSSVPYIEPNHSIVEDRLQAGLLLSAMIGKEGEHETESMEGLAGALPLPQDLQAQPIVGQIKDASDLETKRYTDGPSKIVLANDGTNDCLAVLLTETMVADLKDMFTASCKVDTLKKRFKNAKRDTAYAQNCLESAQVLSENSDNDEHGQTHTDLEGLEDEVSVLSRTKNQLEKELEIYRLNLSFFHDQSENLFKRVLGEAGLLENCQAADGQHDGTNIESEKVEADRRSDVGGESNESITSLESLNRRATLEKVYETRERLHTLQLQFDSRQETYDEDFRQYRQMVAEGACTLAESEFDRIELLNGQYLTRELINAEYQYQDAKNGAGALGVMGNDIDQESQFVSDYDDGYRESQEASISAGVNREFIEAWTDEVAEFSDDKGIYAGEKLFAGRGNAVQESDAEEKSDAKRESDSVEQSIAGEGSNAGEVSDFDEADEWETKTVEICDSISLVDTGKNRRRIDTWRRFCEE